MASCGILLWGFRNQRITNLQKSAMRVTLNKYNAHTEPIKWNWRDAAVV